MFMPVSVFQVGNTLVTRVSGKSKGTYIYICLKQSSNRSLKLKSKRNAG